MRHYANLSFILAVGHLMPDADISGICPHQPMFSPTVNCLYPGRCLEIISMLKDWLRASMEVVVIPFDAKNVWNSPLPGEDPSTNAIQLTQNGTASFPSSIAIQSQVDTTCTFWQDDPNVTDIIYSNPVFQLDLVFIVREKAETLDIFATFDVFTPTVWFVCLATFLVNALTFAMVSIVEQRLTGGGKVTERDVVDSAWNVIRMQLRMAVERPNREVMETTAGKILFLEFNTFLLTSLYSGLLLSFLLYETNKLPFSDGNEAVSMIASGRYKLVLQRENDATDRVRFSQLPLMEALRSALITYSNSSAEAVHLVSAGTHIALDFVDSEVRMIAKSQCNLVSIPSGLPRVPVSFMLHKHATRLRKALNDAIANNPEFIIRTFQKYFDPAFRPYSLKDNCTAEELTPSSILNLTKVFGIFALLFVCLIGSTVAFLTEILVGLCNKMRKRRKNTVEEVKENSATAESTSEIEKNLPAVEEVSLSTVTTPEVEKELHKLNDETTL